jgi:radical SAM protein with 4Fe4S-binding SPASM domain
MRTRPDFCVDKELYVKSQHWNNCWFGKAAITSEGEVMPCVFARDQVAGNLNENSLQFIVENSLSQYWKLTRDKISVCRDCEYRYICKDCRPWAYGYSGDLHAKSPTCTYDPYTGEWGEAELALGNSKQGSNATAVQNSNL